MSGVEIEGLRRRFGAVDAVAGLDLRVQPGELVTLLGPSGCGKTTTLRLVAGLERCSEGRIRIGEQLVDDAATGIHLPPERRGLGMVFQSYAIWPHLSVFENVAYPLRIRRRPTDEVRRRVAEALRLVELDGLAERAAPALSGGQQQRVAIARALVFEPAVLLLDEPMSNLDARLRLQMGDDFRRLQQRLGLTTLYVTHDQAEALMLSDRVVLMQGGRILQVGTPDAVYHRPVSGAVAAFFGTPNLWRATVLGCTPAGEGRWTLQLQGGGASGPCGADRPRAVGDEVQVLLRAEDLLQVTGGAPAQPPGAEVWRWRGRLRDVVFRGSTRALRVDCDGVELRAEVPSMQPAAVGDAVELVARAGAAWALAG